MYSFPKMAETKNHKFGGSKHRNSFSDSSAGHMPKSSTSALKSKHQ